MTRFSTAHVDKHGNLIETNVREISQADMLKCPHFIMMAEHYRQDGTCRCNDPDHTEMKEWGYTWKHERWV